MQNGEASSWLTKIQGLQAKISSLDVDRPPEFQCSNYEQRIRQVEDRILREDSLSRDKLEQLKEEMNRLAAGVGEECAHISQLSYAVNEQLKSLQGLIQGQIAKDRQQSKEAQGKLLRNFQENISSLKQEQMRLEREKEQKLTAIQAACRDELERAEEELQAECEARELQNDKLIKNLATEIHKLDECFYEEQRARQQSQQLLMERFQALSEQFQREMLRERKEREGAEQLLLRLIERTCQKVEQNIRRKLN